MITERTLRKWRKEALEKLRHLEHKDIPISAIEEDRSIAERILRLTQELLDQHLLRK